MDTIDRENFRLLLAAFIDDNELSLKKIAKSIGCSVATLARIIDRKTLPSDEMMRQGSLMMGIGFQAYVCFQKVVDKSGMKLREGFRPHILPSQYSRKS